VHHQTDLSSEIKIQKAEDPTQPNKFIYKKDCQNFTGPKQPSPILSFMMLKVLLSPFVLRNFVPAKQQETWRDRENKK